MVSSLVELADIDEMAGDGGGGGHGGADQVGAAARSLAALEVAVAGAGRALTGLELVGVHGQAHAASGLPPFGAGLEKDAVQALGFGLVPDRLAPGHDQRLHAGGGLSSLENSGRCPQVFDPAIGARADEDDVDRDLADRRAGVEPHVLQCATGRLGRGEGDLVGTRNDARHVDCHGGVGTPGYLGHQRAGVDRDVAIEIGRVVGPEGLPVGDRGFEGRASRRERPVAARDVVDRHDRRGQSARPARLPRSTCCRSSSALPSTGP